MMLRQKLQKKLGSLAFNWFMIFTTFKPRGSPPFWMVKTKQIKPLFWIMKTKQNILFVWKMKTIKIRPNTAAIKPNTAAITPLTDFGYQATNSFFHQ